MNNRALRTAAVLVAAVATLTLSACSSSSNSSTSTSTTTTAQTDGFQNNGGKKPGKDDGAQPAPATSTDLPKPTVAELNEKINKAFDPSIPAKTKVDWVENAGQDPDLVDKLAQAAKQNDVKVTITKVEDPSGGKLKADADVTMGGTPVNGASVPFVADGGQWKVDHAYACSIVKQAKLDSAACQ
ncbi:hypothetical protein [Nocardia stercoris]|uniref:Low molecular weight antigen MTB12-like C-terminal domain-containing protein n=1 Tax=Nocardia stercoris TaxID=2483361 RepID=A0A3M2KV27_9NOCA|nr:hypothetical protein [Nocardia stercoris]RMI28526.1 hypothetical protein EBN03_29315 [Nocardia stercoris]